MPYVAARWFTSVPGGRPITLCVLHDMEYPEALTAAEDVAQFFARGSSQASAHVCVDPDSSVRCVNDRDVAWHAPGANRQGLGIEHAGYARQTAQEWADAYSSGMLARSAAIVADWCTTYGIPAVFVDAAGLRASHRGITTHWEVTKAYATAGGHTDPGPNFPMDTYLDLVHQHLPGGTVPETAPTSNAPMVALLAHASWGAGYVEVFADGGVAAWGGAPFHGSTGATHLNHPIVAADVTPTGGGYWLVGADGGVFSFGDAAFHGSMGDKTLNRAIVGMRSTPTGQGYLLCASDGGLFAFGDAKFAGTLQYAGT